MTKTMPEIIPARSTHSQQLIEIWHAGWHESHARLVPSTILAYRSFDHFGIWLSECTDSFYVAEDNGQLQGFVSINDSEIVKLYVRESSRGTGVAVSLMSRAESILFQNGFNNIKLFCIAGNFRAQKFYERQGWSLTQTFEDALWMPKGVHDKFLVETHRYGKRWSSPM